MLVAFAGIQPMIATLILMIAGRGIAQLLTNGVRIQIFYEPYAFIGNGWVFLPFSLAIVVVFFALAWTVTRMTSLGMFIESVGINARSSFYSGINEKRVKLFVYMFSGFCAAMAGVVASCQHPDVGCQRDRAELRARRDPRRRHRRDPADRRSLLAPRECPRRDRHAGDHHVDVRPRRTGQRAPRGQGRRRRRRDPAAVRTRSATVCGGSSPSGRGRPGRDGDQRSSRQEPQVRAARGDDPPVRSRLRVRRLRVRRDAGSRRSSSTCSARRRSC